MKRTTSALEASIDKLSVPARMACLSKYALNAPADELTDVVHQWLQSDQFYRHLAVHLAWVARRADLLAPLIDDPHIGPSVIVHLLELGAADAVAARLDNLPMNHRIAFYKVIRRHGLTAVADAVIGPVRARFGDEEATRVIGVCSPEVAAEHLPGLLQLLATNFGGRSITRLVRRAPELVAAEIGKMIDEWPPQPAAQLLAGCGDMVNELARCMPEAAFGLLEPRPIAYQWMDADDVDALAAADPSRTAALLAKNPRMAGQSLGRASARRMAALDGLDAEVVGLLRAYWQNGDANSRAAQRLLKAIAPHQRVEAVGADLLTTTEVTDSVAELLPAVARHDYSRRWLARHGGDDLATRLPWLALLPVAELDDVFELTHNPDPDWRASAYRTLIKAALAERTDEAIEQLLAGFTRLTNEADPVRQAVAQALSGAFQNRDVPPGAQSWLDGFITAVQQAQDTSPNTVVALIQLVTSALNGAALTGNTDGVKWALRQLDTLLATAHGIWNPLGQCKAAVDAALPHVRDWMKRWPIHRRMQQVAQLLRLRRPWVWDVTAPLVRADALKAGGMQGSAISYYLADPRHRDERLEEVLKAAPSAAYFWASRAALAGRRTDLLDQYLRASPVEGRFSNKDAIFGASEAQISRWLPRQQCAYVAALTKRMFNAQRLPTSWHDAARSTAAASSAPSGRFDRYFKGTVLPVEAALGALPHAGFPPEQVAQRLLTEADTDRARLAMYALNPVWKQMPPDKVIATIRPYLLGVEKAKITSVKALIQQADQVGLPGVAALMADVLAQPRLHRDVAYAAAGVLSRHIDGADARATLGGLSSTNPMALAGVLRTSPMALAPVGRAALAGLVADMLASDDEITRSLARGRYQQLATWAPQGNAVLIGQMLDPMWAEWRRSTEALGLVAATGVVDGIVAAVATLVARADAEQGAAPNTEADLPSLRCLEVLVNKWAMQSPQPAASVAGMHEVADALATTELTRPLAVRGLIRASSAASKPHIDAGLFGAAAALCEPWLGVTMSLLFNSSCSASDPGEILALAQKYCESPAAGLFSNLTRAPGGWTSAWLDVLARLRRHPDPSVRAAANGMDPSAV